jgi:hypothetical protein
MPHRGGAVATHRRGLGRRGWHIGGCRCRRLESIVGLHAAVFCSSLQELMADISNCWERVHSVEFALAPPGCAEGCWGVTPAGCWPGWGCSARRVATAAAQGSCTPPSHTRPSQPLL